MKTINEIEDELRPEYKRSDFDNMVRGKYAQRLKTEKISTTFPLDSDILLFLKKQASKQQLDYPLLINSLLRDYMNNFATQHPELK
jgi:predicted DNA binding CopG/RHH family protein